MERKRHYHLELTDEQVVAMRRALPLAVAPHLEGLRDQIKGMVGEEDFFSLALSNLRAWYYGRVRGFAEDVLEAILRGEVRDLHDYICETIDGTDLVVYTNKTEAALLASDNEDAMEYETRKNGTPEERAYYALRADVVESLRAMVDHPDESLRDRLPDGFDLDDPATWTAREVRP